MNISELVITDNTEEKISIKADGERFALVALNKHYEFFEHPRVTILTYREGAELAGFIKGEIIRSMMEGK